MKNKFLVCLTAAGLLLSGAAYSGMASSDSHSAEAKPLSKISAVQNMPDDSMVYIQGYITQNLGDEMYVFQDDTGSMNIEIDDELMAGNTTSPTTIVWIAAEVNKEGDITSLEAEEIQFMPEMNTATNTTSSSD